MFDRWKRYEAWVEYGEQPKPGVQLDENGMGDGAYPGRWLGMFWTEKAALRAIDRIEFAPGEPHPQFAIAARVADKGGAFAVKEQIDCRYLAPPDPTAIRKLHLTR